jgi:hypothetical protein
LLLRCLASRELMPMNSGSNPNLAGVFDFEKARLIAV